MIIDINDTQHIHSEIIKDKELIAGRFEKGRTNLSKAYNKSFVNEKVYPLPFDYQSKRNNWKLYIHLPRQKRLEKMNMVAILKVEQDRGRIAHTYFILLDYNKKDQLPLIFSKHFVKRLHERIGFNIDKDESVILQYYLKEEFTIYSKWKGKEYEYRCVNNWGFVKVKIFQDGATYFRTIITKKMLWEKEVKWVVELFSMYLNTVNKEQLDKLMIHWGEFVNIWDLQWVNIRNSMEKINNEMNATIQDAIKDYTKALTDSRLVRSIGKAK